MKSNTLSKDEKWNLLSIPILFAVGSLFHFLYELARKSPIIGAIAAVNESVWEHQKMVLLPVISWWTIYYFLKRDKSHFIKEKWFTGLTVSLMVSIMTIPFLFYFYTEAFGIESLILDILILLMALAIGQLVGFHFYKFSNGIPLYLSIAITAIIFIIFIIFTFNTPQLPWFKDGHTGKYGIM